MDRELEILESSKRSTGSKALQTGLFVFACIGFTIKLLYSLNMYGQLSRDLAILTEKDIVAFINYMKWLSIGIFVHSLLLFTGSLLMLLRRKIGSWFYFTGQGIFIVTLFFQFNTAFRGGATGDLLLFAAFMALPVACIVLNIINRHYWQNRFEA